MNRRQLLKGLATLPVVSALSGCHKEEQEHHPAPAMHTVEVHLDGAFAVVIQKHKGDSILAFSPRDPAEPHKFDFYGRFYGDAMKQLDLTKNYHFSLPAEGLEKADRTMIKPGFEDFLAETEHWRLPDSLVTVELPRPESISFSGHREFVTFASPKDGSRHGWMAPNHVLKYRARDASRIKLLCSQLGEECPASSDSPPGTARFFFEVGPPRDSDPQHTHAKNFFNNMLKNSFPDLVEKYSIAEFGYQKERNKQTEMTAPRLMPAVLSYSDPSLRLRTVSYTLDCQSGGIITNTGSSPTGP